jgi:hypothetical protein
MSLEGVDRARPFDQAAVAKVPVLHVEIVKRSDGMTGFVVLPRPLRGGAHLLLVRMQLTSRQGFRNLTGLHRTMAKVCKSDGEGTFAGTDGNGEVAPIPAVRGQDDER